MARKSSSQAASQAVRNDWYLPEWMRTLGVSQAKLAKECDWNASTMHGIYHGRTAYYREIVNLIADKLNIAPYELLLHPSDAMAMRNMMADAAQVSDLGRRLRIVSDRTGTDG